MHRLCDMRHEQEERKEDGEKEWRRVDEVKEVLHRREVGALQDQVGDTTLNQSINN